MAGCRVMGWVVDTAASSASGEQTGLAGEKGGLVFGLLSEERGLLTKRQVAAADDREQEEERITIVHSQPGVAEYSDNSHGDETPSEGPGDGAATTIGVEFLNGMGPFQGFDDHDGEHGETAKAPYEDRFEVGVVGGDLIP